MVPFLRGACPSGEAFGAVCRCELWWGKFDIILEIGAVR